jgi:hypothetical protein
MCVDLVVEEIDQKISADFVPAVLRNHIIFRCGFE